MAYNAPWMRYARNLIGTKEIAGAQHNTQILEFSRILGLTFMTTDDSEHPWCAAFVGAVLEMSGYLSTRKANAKSYLNWGQTIDPKKAQIGDIAVFNRGAPTSPSGHVGFIAGYYEPDGLMILGGNQSNEVNLQMYPERDLIAVRRPRPADVVYPLPTSQVLPSIYDVSTSLDQLPIHLGGEFEVPTILTEKAISEMTAKKSGTRNSANLPKNETTATPIIAEERPTNLLDIVLGFFVLGKALKGKKTALGVGGLVAYTIATAIAGAFGIVVPAGINEAILQALTAYAGGGVVAKVLPSLDALGAWVNGRVKTA